MAVNYNDAVKSLRMRLVIDAVDGTANPGRIVITDLSNTLAMIPLTKPSFTEAGGVITLAGVPRSASAVANGTASVARIEDGNGVTVISGLVVGLTGAEIILNSTIISAGQLVTLNSGTITHG